MLEEPEVLETSNEKKDRDRQTLLNLAELLLRKETELDRASGRIRALEKQIGAIRTRSIPVMNRHIVNASDLGCILGKSEKTIRRWEEEGIISSKRIPTGGKETLLFDVPEVFADLDRYSKRAF